MFFLWYLQYVERLQNIIGLNVVRWHVDGLSATPLPWHRSVIDRDDCCSGIINDDDVDAATDDDKASIKWRCEKSTRERLICQTICRLQAITFFSSVVLFFFPLLLFFTKKWSIRGLFFLWLLVFSIQFIIQLIVNRICRWLDSNPGYLVLEVSALPTERQPLLLFLEPRVQTSLAFTCYSYILMPN